MSFLKRIQEKFSGSQEPRPASPTPAPSAPSPTPASATTRAPGAHAHVPPKSGALDQVKHLIAVGSGKGGVGKSTVALNLALALAQEGHKVGIVDADVHGPSLQQMTRAARPTMTDDDLLVPSEYEGVKVMSIGMFAAPGQAQLMRGPMVTQVIRQFLTQVVWGELDYLVIDLPPGTGDIHLTLAQMVPLSGAVLVTTPQEVSLIDVRKAVHMFQTVNVPVLGIVENMSYFICDGCDKKHYIFRSGGGKKLAAEADVPLLAELPLDPRVADSGDAGVAFVVSNPSSAVGQAYLEMAKQVKNQHAKLQRDSDGAMGYFLLEWKRNV
ncbi:MAG TPA: Mrp/NBP35 family ATP-binding protein [Oligoflexus sp.]|uniref:Mrp/NBP35 family ATP-binding protein n=1 Tax=Oligoflexus sp. TaxID=1971216 RepID=UPI002D57F0AF|nr:Mrp/NBP35 family ATP-binding protein [Oligoflexus sp.]HYX33529.1 Mrp/NBP35 family ATP-binding protein [Oligoflexus sp.]